MVSIRSWQKQKDQNIIVTLSGMEDIDQVMKFEKSLQVICVIITKIQNREKFAELKQGKLIRCL